ncbi:MAG: PAS domain S-box protein [Eubacteriales bacterium]|nr:PAS domain S-box protein [Eubacteriales bacterium]
MALINNVALLLVLSVIYQLTSLINTRYTRLKQIVNGLLIALICIAIMSMPFKPYKGVIFDTRSILISVTALVFGLIPTIITMVAAIVFRILQGGAGVLMGVAVIISSAIIGLIWRFRIHSISTKLRWLNVYIMSVLVHVTMIACMTLLPYPVSKTVIREISLPVLLIYPIASVLLYLLLSQQQEFMRVRDQLKQSEERFRLLFDKAPLGYQSLDIDGTIVDVNQQWLDTSGFSRDEVIGKWFGDLLHPTHKEEFLDKFSQLEKKGQIHCEFEMLHKSGESLFIAVDGNIVYGPNGEVKQTLCILKDITKQYKAEADLQASESKYRRLYETMAQGVVYQAADGRILSANPAAERILGLSLDQMMGMSSLDPGWGTIREDGSKISGSDHPSMIAIRTGKPYGPLIMGVYQPMLNDHAWISVNAIPIFEKGDAFPSMAYTTFQDITTERKANQQYQLLFNEMVDSFALHEIICDDQGTPINYKFLAVNPAFEKMTGLKAADILGKTVLDVLPSTESYWIETYGKVALTGESVSFDNYATATDKYFRIIAYQPAPMQFACTFSDDTTRVRAEQALKESEKKYSSYIENAPYAVFVTDENGQYIEANSAASTITGYSREQLLKMTIKDFSPEECVNEAMRCFTSMLETGNIRTELKYIHKDGSIRWWTVDGVKISENRFLGFSIDITSKKQAEEELTFQSVRDYLTGLYNRRHYETQLQRLDIESQLPLSIITGDINGLKLVNDAFGHAKGDKLIIESAKIIEGCCRKGDILARTGGDEFGIIMPKTDSATALEVLRNIQTALKKFDSETNVEMHKHSVSLGYATKEKVEENIVHILKTAEEHMYQRKLLEANSVHSAIVASIKATMFEKSHETEEHAERMVTLSKAIGMELNLSQVELDKLELLATLHDIGKVGIRDFILTKPDKLSESEWAEMKRHPEIGYRIAITSPELVPVAEGILYHHEWWNGSGYPKGICGENIPLHSRIIAVVDAYDAMTNDRPYRKAMESSVALEIIVVNAGTQFDPKIAGIFTDILSKE